MSSNLVSLSWDGHHKTLVSVFEKLLENSHSVYCTIIAEGQKVKVHTEVLSAFSPFFELLFREEAENNPTVIISGISFRDLRALINFMYQGKLEVTVDRIEDLIDAAECLQINGLGNDHKEAGSGNINNTIVLPKKPALPADIPNKRTRKAESVKTARVFSKKSDVHNVNFSNIPHMNSDLVTCVAKQTSDRNLIPSSDVQNVAIVSNISLMPVQSTLSEIEMDSLHLQGKSMVKEPEPDGDKNISEPMGDTTKRKSFCGNIENSNENCGEEHLGLPPDISVPSERNVYEGRLLESAPPAVQSSQSCSRDLTGCSVNNEVGINNVNISSETVDPVVSVGDTQDPLYHSKFHIKTDQSLLSVDNDLKSEHDDFSEYMPVIIGVSSASDMQIKMVCTEQEDDCSGAVSGSVSDSTYIPQEFQATCVEIQRIGRSKPALGLMPGLPAEVDPRDSPTPVSNTTPACEDLSGLSGGAITNGSVSTDQEFRCQICGEAFTRHRQLNVHMRIHAKDREFRKDECNNAAIASSKINTHQCGRRLYQCTVCNFKSLHRSALCIHKKIHSGEKPYNCAECGYSTIRKDHLIAHMQIHSKVKPHKCKECNYTTACIGYLKTHQLIHRRSRHYKCPECDYATGHMGNLKRHCRKHSKMKPYKCTECDYRAATMINLKTHQQIHSEEKSFKCTECGYACAHSSHLKRHQRSHSRSKH